MINNNKHRIYQRLWSLIATWQWLIVLFFLIMVHQPVSAIDAKKLIAEANQKYDEGLYHEAIDLYDSVLQQNMASPEIYFNMGNAHYKLRDYPSAILYYEKAKKLDPHNEDVGFNLKVARTHIVDKIEKVPEFFLRSWINSLGDIFTVDRWAKIGLVTFFAFFVLLSIYLFSRILWLRKISFWISVVLLLSAFVSLGFSWKEYADIKRNKEAIVFSPTITVKSSPNRNSVDLFVIHEGTKVSVIQELNDWYEIRIENGSVGWLPASSLKKI